MTSNHDPEYKGFLAKMTPDLLERIDDLRIIDPKVDCVFKAILGSEEHKHLLVHFLNAVFENYGQESNIASVKILNPFNAKTYLQDKLSIVDINAKDREGRAFQIELQLDVRDSLASRMLYTWASLLTQQIKEGGNYGDINPTYSIWILNGSLFRKVHRVHTCFKMYSKEAKRSLSDLAAIHVLQLKDVVPGRKISKSLRCWLRFLNEGADWVAGRLPKDMDIAEMNEAVAIRDSFIDDDEQRALYLSRLDAQRATVSYAADYENAVAKAEHEQAAKEEALFAKERERAAKERERAAKERERAAKEEALLAKEQERAAKEKALAVNEQLLDMLKRNGIEPKLDDENVR